MTSPEHPHGATDAIEMPAPTHWPLVAALGLSLLFAGLVTHCRCPLSASFWRFGAPSVGGMRCCLTSTGGLVAFLPLEQRARPIQPAPHKVEYLVAGVGGHRVRIPAEVHPYSAGVWGGLAGGAAMAVLAALYGVLKVGSFWYPINLMAAVVMPSLAQASTAELAAFNSTALAVASVVHVIVSLFVGLVYAAILPMFPRHPAIWGGWIAPLLWSALLWASLSLINPILNARIDWLWFIASQVAFGLTAGFVVARTVKIGTMQTWPLATRAGVEAAAGVEDRNE